jgi:hypothetical protein
MPYDKFDGPSFVDHSLPTRANAFASRGVARAQAAGPNLAVLELRLSSLSSNQSLNLIAHQALAFTAADGAAIAVSGGDAVICRARVGSLAPPLGSAVSRDAGICGACMSGAEVINCGDPESDPRVDAEACRHIGIRSILAVPLTDEGQSFGVFAVFSRNLNAFAEREMEAMLLLSGLIRKPDAAHLPVPESFPEHEDSDHFVASPSVAEVSPALDESVVDDLADTKPVVESSRRGATTKGATLSSSRQIANCLNIIRHDAGLQLLGRVKAYLRIESLYDGADRSPAIDICHDAMLCRARELGVTPDTNPVID